MAAATSLGAEAFEVSVNALGFSPPTPLKGMGAGVKALSPGSAVLEAVAPALERAHFVVDLVRETIVHLPLRERLNAAGVRSLTIVEPPDVLERLLSTPEIKDRALRIARRLELASSAHVSSPAGTDLTYSLNNQSAAAQYGYSDEPGRWDHWPSALAVCYPEPRSAVGTVVLAPGDIVFPFKRYLTTEVVLEISDGYVTAVRGGLEAELIKDYLDSWDDSAVYAVSHIGFGVHPRAQWTALEFYEKDAVMGMDGRSYPGNFIFSTGPDRHTGRLVQAHLDVPMRGCTVRLDGDELLVDAGQLCDRTDGAREAGLGA
jgi:2,5-dihydroxypyridine 5,6-dioxygenase